MQKFMINNNLGIFLALGDSITNLRKVGQDTLFYRTYLNAFARQFNHVYIFSYYDEEMPYLADNIYFVPNKWRLNRFIYSLMLPFLNWRIIVKCGVIRVYHLSGTIPAIITRLFFGKPYVFNFAYDYIKFARIEKKIVQALLFFTLGPIAIYFAKYVFCANKRILSSITKRKRVYLPNGVDINQFLPSEKVRASKRPIVLSVGRLEPQKNHLNMLDALRRFGIEILIIGKGSLKKQILQRAKVLRLRIKIITKIDHKKMPGIYKKSDYFLMPSKAEGHPKALLEAMACGLPILATRVDGTSEIILDGYNGLLADIDTEAFSNKFEMMLKNVALCRLISKNARLTVLRKYNITTLLKQEVKTLKRALK